MLETLVKNGLSLLAKAVSAKGFAWLKEKTGVDIEAAELSSEDALKLKQYEMEHEKELLEITTNADSVAAQEISKRWQADMTSDSWLSKNVRPAILIAVTIFVGIGLMSPSIPAEKFGSIENLATIVFLAYFGFRTTEKGVLENVISAWKGGKKQ